MVFFSSRISPFTSTVIFLDRSPFATAVVTAAMLRTWAVRLPAMKFTLSVRSFQVPETPSTLAWPPSLPSVPTSRATRVTSEANDRSWSTIVLMVFLSSRNSPLTSTVILRDRSPLATAVVPSAMFRTWPVRFPAMELTGQVRNIAEVTTAVANGDLSRKITVDVKGEILELKNTINTMVDQLNSFGSEVTRVAREVGSEGKLGGQAAVPGVAGTWKDLTDNVNFMANNLTAQVRNIAEVATAIANGDLSRKITVDVKGEILELKDTINTMVD